jgi:hypothetical protein
MDGRRQLIWRICSRATTWVDNTVLGTLQVAMLRIGRKAHASSRSQARPSCRSSRVSNARIQVDACSALTPSFQCSSWPRLTPKRSLSHVTSQSPTRLPHLETRPGFNALRKQEGHSFVPYCSQRSTRHQYEQRSFSRVKYSATSEVLDSGPYGR